MIEGTDARWRGRWDLLTGRAKHVWSELTDDDLAVAEGDLDELVGRIEGRTGEPADSIREWLHWIAQDIDRVDQAI